MIQLLKLSELQYYKPAERTGWGSENQCASHKRCEELLDEGSVDADIDHGNGATAIVSRHGERRGC